MLKQWVLLLCMVAGMPYEALAKCGAVRADKRIYKRPAGIPEGKCYCSDVCELRDIKPDDRPFYDEGDPEHYWCKQRDKDNYYPHGCPRKENQPKQKRSRVPYWQRK